MYVIRGIFNSGDWFYLGHKPRTGSFTMLNPATEAFQHKGGFRYVQFFLTQWGASKAAKQLVKSLKDNGHEVPSVVVAEKVLAKVDRQTKYLNVFNLFTIKLHV